METTTSLGPLVPGWLEPLRSAFREAPAPEQDLSRLARIRGAAVGLVVLTVYGVINLYTATRAVPLTPMVPGEEKLPFVPWMIMPYLGLYPAFFGAFRLARDPGDARVLVRRVMKALAISALLFLLFPFRSARVRPSVEGPLGMLVSLLAMDMPYNQAPSLHVSLSVIFAATFLAHGRPERRRWVIPAFGTIVASTLFVYQHHVIDVTTGLMLGAACLLSIRQRQDRCIGISPPHDAARDEPGGCR